MESRPMRLRAWVESVYDGDTFTVVVEEWPSGRGGEWREVRPNLFVQFYDGFKLVCGVRERIKVRLLGVDAPEVRGEEKAEGKVSTEWVKAQFDGLEHVFLRMEKEDSFGRWLCDVTYGDKNLADEMLKSGMAEVYSRSRGANDEDIMEVPW